METYTSIRAVPAEGNRVGLCSCLTCGSCLVLDSYDVKKGVNVIEIHDNWHSQLRARGVY